MSFIWPNMLLFLLLVPLLIVGYILVHRRRQRLFVQYGRWGFVSSSEAGKRAGVRRHIPSIVFLVGLTILLVALARPQAVVSVPRIEGVVMLVFDVSGSMSAEDMEPNRMEAAKAAAKAFIEGQPSGVRVGIVAFSDGGLAVQPPSNDKDTLLASINRLSPQRGTSLGQGILTSLHSIANDLGMELSEQEFGFDRNALRESLMELPESSLSSGVVVLLSDGENNESPDPMETTLLAKKLGARIHTIGVGTVTGATIHIEGFTVHSRLDEEMLKSIAQVSGGNYFYAGDEQMMTAIYEDINRQLVVKPEDMEVTSLFAGGSLLVLLLGGAFSLLWFNRLP